MNPALISTFIWTLFLFCCPHPAWTTQAEATALLEMETKMASIIDRMERMEADMETKDQRIVTLELDKVAKDQRIAVLEDQNERLRGRMTETEETDLQLREMVDQVKNPPFAFQCAWKEQWTDDNTIVTYDRLTYDDISGGTIYNVTGGMDISTGVFTVGHGFSGVWTVSYTIRSRQGGGHSNSAWLYHNGDRIEESYHSTYNGNYGSVESLGSRTLHMSLEEGDQVTLRTGEINLLEYITVCFELSQFDYKSNP